MLVYATIISLSSSLAVSRANLRHAVYRRTCAMLSTADLRPSRWHVTEEKLVFLRLHFLDLAHQLLLRARST
jgi:hypothetical protein